LVISKAIGWFAGLDSGARLRRARNQEYRQTPHALSPVNQNALDVGGCRRARYQHRVAGRLEPRVAIGVMQVTNDIAGIEQSDEVLRKICKGIDLQLSLAEPD
jgi:hypothetical protein